MHLERLGSMWYSESFSSCQSSPGQPSCTLKPNNNSQNETSPVGAINSVRSSLAHFTIGLHVRKMNELKITSISGLIAAFGSGLTLTIIAFLEHLNEPNKGMLKMVLEFPAGIAFNGLYSFVFSIPFLLILVFPLVCLHRSLAHIWNYFLAPPLGIFSTFLVLSALVKIPSEIVWIATAQAGIAFGVAFILLRRSSNQSAQVNPCNPPENPRTTQTTSPSGWVPGLNVHRRNEEKIHFTCRDCCDPLPLRAGVSLLDGKEWRSEY